SSSGSGRSSSLHSPLQHLLDRVQAGLAAVEDGWIEYKQAKNREERRERRRKARREQEGKPAPDTAALRHDKPSPIDLRQLLLSGLLALSRMSSDAAPSILLFTDGIVKISPGLTPADPVWRTLLQQQAALHVLQLNA